MRCQTSSKEAAKHIAAFVERGGIVISDCAVTMDAYRRPMKIMNELFGISDAVTERIVHRLEEITPEDLSTINGEAFAANCAMTIVSPRPCQVHQSAFALPRAGRLCCGMKSGRGGFYYLGFCLQDSYFNTWKNEDVASRNSLYRLVGIFTDAGVRGHVYSTNPDIEAAVRANSYGGYLFVINHESTEAATTIRLAELPFEVMRITNAATGEAVPYRRVDDAIELDVLTPFGEVALLELSPAHTHFFQLRAVNGKKSKPSCSMSRWSMWLTGILSVSRFW